MFVWFDLQLCSFAINNQRVRVCTQPDKCAHIQQRKTHMVYELNVIQYLRKLHIMVITILGYANRRERNELLSVQIWSMIEERDRLKSAGQDVTSVSRLLLLGKHDGLQ